MNEVLHTLDEARKQLNCGHTQIYKLINAGKLKAVKMGKNTRVPSSAMQEFISGLPAYKSETT
jgi:excisionase family DNA binding protein